MDRISKAVERSLKEQRENVHLFEHPGSMPSPSESDINRISISRDVLSRNRIWLGEEHAASSQAFKVLRTRIWHQLRSNGWHSLGITSTNPGEGKTMTAINLAINLAMMEIGRMVVLVDLDMRRPGVHRDLGIHPQFGVSDFFLSGVPLSKIMINIGIDRLVVIPGNTAYINSSEILSSKKIIQLFQEIRNIFPTRIVIVDLPPVLAGDDVLVVSPNLNSMLLVIEDGRTENSDLSKAIELLNGISILGTVLNKSSCSIEQNYGY